MEDAIIDVKNVFYEYPKLRALDNVSFTIKPKTITALVGHNGAGKTTLLRCIATLDRPFSGEIFVDGANNQDDPRSLHKKLGYLSDFFGLYDDLTVKQCLIYMAWSHDIYDNIEEKIHNLSVKLNLHDLLGRKTQELSRGQRQRLAIAQATIHNPKILLLDEPASGLDPEARHQLSELLINMRDDGMTIIVSSHILTELEEYSSEMLILHGGKVKEQVSLSDMNKNNSLISISINVNDDIKANDIIKNHKINEIFKDNKNVNNSEVKDGNLLVEFSGDEKQKADLLSSLVRADIPIFNFTSQNKSFENIYIEAIGREDD